VCENVKHVYNVESAVVVLFDSPGVSSQHCAAATTQPPLFHGSDHATLLEAFRSALSSSQFRQLYAIDPATELLWTEQTGRQNELPVVAEESSDDEHCGAYARDAEEYDKYNEREERHAYSCDHCHCSVCKRSLEQHECQRSRSSCSEHEVVSDDAGGSVPQSLIYSQVFVVCISVAFVFVVKLIFYHYCILILCKLLCLISIRVIIVSVCRFILCFMKFIK